MIFSSAYAKMRKHFLPLPIVDCKCGRLNDNCGFATLCESIRGELVPQDPNDEPATVLLERIKAEMEAANGSKKVRTKT